MICAIHQPQFLPWLGYLHKIACADIFVFLDNVQFKKNEFQNRNKILINGEAKWLTVPVSFNFGDTICRTKLAEKSNWRSKIIRTLEQNYAKAPLFQKYGPEIINIINQECDNLAEFNQATVVWLAKCFNIHSKILVASALPEFSHDPTQRLIDICLHVKADTYLSGAGGHDYLDTAKFQDAHISLEFQNFLHPEYPQCYSKHQNEFVSHLSAVDMLFNCDVSSIDIRKLNGATL